MVLLLPWYPVPVPVPVPSLPAPGDGEGAVAVAIAQLPPAACKRNKDCVPHTGRPAVAVVLVLPGDDGVGVDEGAAVVAATRASGPAALGATMVGMYVEKSGIRDGAATGIWMATGIAIGIGAGAGKRGAREGARVGRVVLAAPSGRPPPLPGS
jgi:hypothetical protein